MTYLSIMEKFKILFNLFVDFKAILALLVIVLILSLLYIIKKLDTKKYTLAMIGSFILVFAISIITNYKILSNTFEDFTDIFFTNIYFPSIYVYISTLVIVLVSFITSILNKTLKKIYKVINTTMFILNNILLIVILNIIAKNKIDIFSVSSLYTSTNLVAILELSMGLFILWLLSLVIAYTTNCIYERIELRNKIIVNKEVLELSEEITEEPSIILEETPNTIVIEEETIEELPEITEEPSIMLEETPNTIVIEEDTIEELPEVIEEPSIILEETPNTIVIEEEENKITFNDILNGTIPVMYYENEVVTNNYNIINPQEVYEQKYAENKKFQDLIEEIEPVELEETITEEPVNYEIIEEPEIIEDELEEIEVLTSEEEKHAVLTSTNTISLDELEDEEIIINTVSKEKEEVVIEENTEEEYTINDYKQMIKMLNNLKNNSSKSNISIDDAVTLSLISNYSIEDCIKLKEILESNVN